MKGKRIISLDVDMRPVRAIDSLLSRKGAYKRVIVEGCDKFAVYAECDLSKEVSGLLDVNESDSHVVAIDTENQVFFIYSSNGFKKVGQGRFESSVSRICKGYTNE